MRGDIDPYTDPGDSSDPSTGGQAPRAPIRPAGGKSFAAGFSLVLVGATLAPLAEHAREKPRDDFPLSYYPMFTARRGDVQDVDYLKAIDDRGEGRPLSYKLAGAGGLNQTRRQIRRIIRDGHADALCRAVAEKVARGGKKSLVDVVEVQVVTGEYHLASYFTGVSKAADKEVVHATARVERGPR